MYPLVISLKGVNRDIIILLKNPISNISGASMQQHGEVHHIHDRHGTGAERGGQNDDIWQEERHDHPVE